MSKHISRKDRWSQVGPQNYVSGLGPVTYRLDAWYARLVYQVREMTGESDGLPRWVTRDRWLGPFRRPRNAMVELEREVTTLRNRHGTELRVGGDVEIG